MSRVKLILAGAVVTALAVGLVLLMEAEPCDGEQPCPPRPQPASPAGSATRAPPPPGSSDPSGDPVITAAGDIADPDPTEATVATAALITSIDPRVALTLGDNAYPGGALEEYLDGYDPTWGAFASKTRPAIGNHEYESSDTADGYFQYFGASTPDNYYSFDVGTWHLISLDSNCDKVGGCTPGTPQYEWLTADLAANPATCTLAYWHHPRWSSGTVHGNSSQVAPFMDVLYAAGVDVVLSGHEHNYERFAPQTPDGALDPERGIVEFVVGTGGHGLYPLGTPDPNSLVRDSATFGVLRMTLHAASYEFAFEPVLDGTFRDFGSGRCH